MTKTMVSGLLTWLCGLIMLMLLLANIPYGAAAQSKEAAVEPRILLETQRSRSATP